MSDLDTKSAVTAASDGERTYSQRTVKSKPITGTLAIPYREVEPIENAALGFRMEFWELQEDGGEHLARATSGAGCGSEWVVVELRGKSIAIRSTDILLAWAKLSGDEAIVAKIEEAMR